MEKKKASSTNNAGIAGYQHVEEWKEIHIYPHVQNSSPNGLRQQYKYDYTKPDRRESGKYSSMYGHRRPLSKYNISSTDTERTN